VLVDRALLLMSDLREPRPAIDVLERLAKLDPSNAAIPLLIGVCRIDLREDAEALAAFERSLAIERRSDARLYRALGMAFLKRDAEAEAAFGELVDDDAIGAMALSNRGVIRAGLGRADAAADFDAAVARDPKLDAGWRNRAVLALQQDRYEDAARDLAEAAALETHRGQTTRRRGAVLLAGGRLADAERDLREGLKDGVPDELALTHLGLAHFQAGNVEVARKAQDEAVKAAAYLLREAELPPHVPPMIAAIYANRALARFASRDAEGALADLDVCLRYQPRQAAALWERARVKAALGRREEAEADARSAVSIDPGVRQGRWLGVVVLKGDFILTVGYEVVFPRQSWRKVRTSYLHRGFSSTISVRGK
jgi:tetratricopeptide (TPR) repeat protein